MVLYSKKVPLQKEKLFKGHMARRYLLFFLFITSSAFASAAPKVLVGADLLLTKEYSQQLKGKRVGLVTNHTAVTSQMVTTEAWLLENEKAFQFKVAAIFAPEHGIKGSAYAGKGVADTKSKEGIPIYCLQGNQRRPTDAMLQNIDLLIYDIQDIGSRSYTYSTTLFYIMEEAAKHKIPVVVLDRPNPINGITVDGPMLESSLRSMVGYINVPYCHGMTIGELARFFNGEYNIQCRLTVVPMRGWQREMSFQETGLAWVPTSPQIPEATTALYYPITGILGELSLVNIGVGYTLPFKVIGAPWIDADTFAKKLNEQQFPGVRFKPFHYKPFYGKYAQKECNGVLIHVTDTNTFQPVATQYLLLGMIKSLYPAEFHQAIHAARERQEMFHKVNGSPEIFRIMMERPFIIWPLRTFDKEKREHYLIKRKQYLISDYHHEPILAK